MTARAIYLGGFGDEPSVAGGLIWPGTRWYWLWFAPNAEGRDAANSERTRWVFEEWLIHAPGTSPPRPDASRRGG